MYTWIAPCQPGIDNVHSGNCVVCDHSNSSFHSHGKRIGMVMTHISHIMPTSMAMNKCLCVSDHWADAFFHGRGRRHRSSGHGPPFPPITSPTRHYNNDTSQNNMPPRGTHVHSRDMGQLTIYGGGTIHGSHGHVHMHCSMTMETCIVYIIRLYIPKPNRFPWPWTIVVNVGNLCTRPQHTFFRGHGHRVA